MKGVDVLRDRYGNRIGEIQIDGSKQVLVDRYFARLGSYDSHDNLTRDKYGNVVGRGNVLGGRGTVRSVRQPRSNWFTRLHARASADALLLFLAASTIRPDAACNRT